MSAPWTSLIPGELSATPGGSGVGRYEEVFTSTDNYLVNHGLNAIPVVDVLDSNGQAIFVGIEHQSNNSLRLLFNGQTLTDARVICVA